jgi:rhodanese-related sulfurtransferase
MMISEAELRAESTMAEVLQARPGAQRALFRKFHIGGCSSCGFQPEETLEALCKRNGGLAVAEVLKTIEESHLADQRILLPPHELDQWRKDGRPMRLLDIRTREEFDASRINGAILFTHETMNEMLGRWPRTDLVVIYDHLGNKSMDAAAYFLGHGFTEVRALRGGIDAWSLEADPGVRRYRMD